MVKYGSKSHTKLWFDGQYLVIFSASQMWILWIIFFPSTSNFTFFFKHFISVPIHMSLYINYQSYLCTKRQFLMALGLLQLRVFLLSKSVLWPDRKLLFILLVDCVREKWTKFMNVFMWWSICSVGSEAFGFIVLLKQIFVCDNNSNENNNNLL